MVYKTTTISRTILLVLCLFFCSTEMAISQNSNQSLTEELSGLINENSVVGCGVAIFDKKSLLYSKGFGYASSDASIPYTTHTRQKIASISKLLLGISVMKAQELGLLRLDDHINDYLPFEVQNPYFPYMPITIRHLTTHTSSLKSLPKYDKKALYMPTKIDKIKKEMPIGLRKFLFNRAIKKINANDKIPLKSFLENLYSRKGKWYKKKHFLKKEPGSYTEYSNTGASLLALIIEQASEMSYQEFIAKYITEPLKLDNSKFDFEKNDLEETDYNHGGISIPKDFELLLYPAGGFESSISDFYKILHAIFSEDPSEQKILSEESIKEMLTPQFAEEYGITWEIYESGYKGHSGDILGSTSYAYYNINKKMGYMLFCNTTATKSIDDEISKLQKTIKDHFDDFK